MAPKHRAGKEVETSKAASEAPPAIERPITGKALPFFQIFQTDLAISPVKAKPFG